MLISTFKSRKVFENVISVVSKNRVVFFSIKAFELLKSGLLILILIYVLLSRNFLNKVVEFIFVKSVF